MAALFARAVNASADTYIKALDRRTRCSRSSRNHGTPLEPGSIGSCARFLWRPVFRDRSRYSSIIRGVGLLSESHPARYAFRRITSPRLHVSRDASGSRYRSRSINSSRRSSPPAQRTERSRTRKELSYSCLPFSCAPPESSRYSLLGSARGDRRGQRSAREHAMTLDPRGSILLFPSSGRRFVHVPDPRAA